MSRIGEGSLPGPPLLSVVLPCYNEELCLHESHRRLVAVLEAVPDLDFELVYVDDGSDDASLTLLRELHGADPRVRVLSLSRNFGQQQAATAGLREAAGDAVVVMDADLQDPPEVIPELLDRWRRGVKIAYGERTDREAETAFKRWSASAFYRLLGRLVDTHIPRDTGDFRLMDRQVVDAFLAMPERDRFVRGMIAWTGFRQEAVPFRRAGRFAGRSKWPLGKLLGLAASGILAFSPAPLRAAIWIGLVAAGTALAGAGYALVAGLPADGWAPLVLVVLFLGGAQLVVLGILGEYLGRILSEVKRRPLYFVKERLGRAGKAARDRSRGILP